MAIKTTKRQRSLDVLVSFSLTGSEKRTKRQARTIWGGGGGTWPYLSD